jgi:hypothetical protein
MKLGIKVKENITGFIGITVAKCEYLWGCIQFGVQAPVDKDGKVGDILWFDEARLEEYEIKTTPKPTSGVSHGGICQKY